MFSNTLTKETNISTVLTYLAEPEMVELDAMVVEIIQGEDGKTTGIVVDRSPFYVKGGGQKSDIGVITNTLNTFFVQEVRNERGTIVHFGQSDTNDFAIGSKVVLKINSDVRKLHSQIHTAGELICACIKKLGYKWEVIGAIHYPERSSVEFDTILSETQAKKLQNELQILLNTLIQVGNPVSIVTYTDIESIIQSCGYFPNYVQSNESIRIVTTLDKVFGRPCMGTHLSNINELPTVSIREIKSKKGTTIIKYLLE